MTGPWRPAWLAVASLAVAAYGVALVVAGPVAARLFDVLGFGMIGPVPTGPARAYVLFVYGVLGAVLTGWMLTLHAVATARGPHGDLRRLAAVPLAVWFVLDTGLSLRVGQWQHAVFNLGFVTLLGGALLADARRLCRRTAGGGARRGAQAPQGYWP